MSAARSIAAVVCYTLLSAAKTMAQPAPAPTATPAPAPSPAIAVSEVVSGFTVHSDNPNTTTLLTNALVTVARTTGIFRFTATAGAYAFPVVGQAINPTFQSGSNTSLFGWLPNAYAQYVPNANWTISAGKLPTLLGQENAFTFQNINVQRGLVWNAEPVVSNGVRIAYTGSRFTATLEANDGFYSKKYGGFEGALGWNPSAATTLLFAFIVPNPNTPANPTAAVANKQEYDLMYTRQIGKLMLLPYALWIVSPANAALGFTQRESAFGGAVIANYSFNGGAWSLGGRFEAMHNNSALTDTSANADLVGYGPTSNATTFTLTPAYKWTHFLLRGEWSYVAVNGVQGFAFGPAGATSTQTRVGLELAVFYP